MGIRFIKLDIKELDELDNYHPAGTYYQYLVLCSSNRFIPKDKDGYFERSVAQIEQTIKYKRSVQEKARRMLLQRGWISCRVQMQRRSPVMGFRLEKRC